MISVGVNGIQVLLLVEFCIFISVKFVVILFRDRNCGLVIIIISRTRDSNENSLWSCLLLLQHPANIQQSASFSYTSTTLTSFIVAAFKEGVNNIAALIERESAALRNDIYISVAALVPSKRPLPLLRFL